MEPFEISLTFIRVQGWEKNSMGILFRLLSGEKSLGMEKKRKKKSSNAIKYVGVFLLIYSRLF